MAGAAHRAKNLPAASVTAAALFAALAAERHALCGTPAALESFMEEVAAGRALNKVKRRFCFALDSVLVTEPAVEGDYSTVLPIAKNVQLVRELKESGTMGRVSDGAPHARSPTALTPLLLSTGHYIIITTSRMMDSKHGNVGQVIAACGNAARHKPGQSAERCSKKTHLPR